MRYGNEVRNMKFPGRQRGLYFALFDCPPSSKCVHTYLLTDIFLVFSVVVKIRVCVGLRLRRCVFVELRVGLRLRRCVLLGHRMSDLIAVCL